MLRIKMLLIKKKRNKNLIEKQKYLLNCCKFESNESRRLSLSLHLLVLSPSHFI